MIRGLLWILGTFLLAGLTHADGLEAESQQLPTTFSGIRFVTEEDRSGNLRELKEVTVTVHPAEVGEPPQHFVVRGPGDFFWVNEQPQSEIVEDRLLITTDQKILVFDLTTGDQMVDIAGGSKVVASADGRRVAFETESSSVVQVLDVPTLRIEPVFPERSRIELTQLGGLVSRVEEPEDRHSVGKLYFSPGDSRLFFFCTHPAGPPDARQKVHLVVIDLSHELDATHFTHRPFDWKWYIRPDVELGDKTPYFAVESLIWLSNGTVVVTPPPDSWWLQEEIAIPLPNPDRWWIPAEPQMSCELTNQEDLERTPDGALRVSNLEYLRLLVVLVTEAGEIEPLELKERRGGLVKATVEVRVLDVGGIKPHEIPIKLHDSGGGRSLKRHSLHLSLKIPVSEETWNAEFEEFLAYFREVARKEGELAQFERLTSNPEVLRIAFRNLGTWNRPGRYEVRCTYRSDVQGVWSGMVEAPPLVLEIVDDGSFFDAWIEAERAEP